MESPYSPPEAPVADPPRMEIGRRPRSVIFAAVIALLLAIHKLLVLFASIRMRVGPHELDMAFIVALSVLLALGAWFLWRRKAWARWLLFLPLVEEVAHVTRVMRVFHIEPADLLDRLPASAVLLLPTCLILVTLVLVFGPARAWFRH